MVIKKNSRSIFTVVNTLAALLIKFTTLILSFVLRQVFIKTLGIQYTGVSSLFTDILTVLSLAELGIGSAIIYSLYKPISEKNYDQVSRIMKFYRNVYLVIGSAVLIVGCSLIPFLDEIITVDSDFDYNIILIYVLFLSNSVISYLFSYKFSLLTAMQQGYKMSGFEVAFSVTKTILQIISLFVFTNYVLFLVIGIAFDILKDIVISRYITHNYKQYLKRDIEKLSKEERKAIFKNVKALALYKVSDVVLNGTDSILISKYFNAEAVGLVSNYKMIFTNVYSIINQFYVSSQSSVGNLSVEESENKQYSVFNIMYFLSFWMAFFCVVSFSLITQPFISWWIGDEFLLEYVYVIVLAFNFFLMMMIRPVSTFRISNGIFVQGQYRPLIMAILNLVISIILVNYIGIIGILLGTCISRILTQSWFDPMIVYKNVFNKNPMLYFRKLALFSLIIVGTTVGLVFTFNLIELPLILSLVVRILVSLIVPNLIVLLLFNRTKEFKLLINMVKGLIKK